ncbi:DUF4238 domain-containing protein [Devosia sp. Root105]|uniref:DUF4238 domain-containing protein n=1 Tax=Devosia sp. Root105 TaxID=1736423 RepID=UPI0006FDE111|nr:DUF4238 domain-containing protein [Devosia sp. Root105]KQU95250.1 hypothetical protein ASC68_19050 [Devosia sp. Root105]
MARKNSPHRHHYIPQMILRNFVSSEGGLCFWRREFQVGDVRATTPDNLFIEDNLYSVMDDEGGRDVSLEHWFAKMESTGARLIGDLLTVVRSGRTPVLSEDAWEFFCYFHYYSGKRSAAWHSRFVTRDQVVALANRMANELRWTDAERAQLNEPAKLDRVMNNARIAAQGMPPPDDLLAVMRNRGMAIYVVPTGASFVLGDHPIAMARVGKAAEASVGGKTTFMPIACDVAIGYHVRPRTVQVERLTRPQVRAMNEAMTRQSVMIAGRSHALVASLSKLGYETPEYFTTADYLFG